MAAPAWTSNTAGNALASVTLSNSGALQTFVLDFTGVMRGKCQVQSAAGGTVAGTNGCQVSIYSRSGGNGTPVNDTIAFDQFTIPSTVSTTNDGPTFYLDSGLYYVTLKNLDASNNLTVLATSDTLSWPS